MSDFAKELEHLINRHSVENDSDTPDFILASYMMSCLSAWNTHIQQRDGWYNFVGLSKSGYVHPPIDDAFKEEIELATACDEIAFDSDFEGDVDPADGWRIFDDADDGGFSKGGGT